MQTQRCTKLTHLTFSLIFMTSLGMQGCTMFGGGHHSEHHKLGCHHDKKHHGNHHKCHKDHKNCGCEKDCKCDADTNECAHKKDIDKSEM